MARNKHPQETVNLIINTAYRLFLQKGYDHTSIQDIIQHLGGLSKGAIYHHFKSKEEILFAVMDKLSEGSYQILLNVKNRKDLNGKEKLKQIFKDSLNSPIQEELFVVTPSIGKNPIFLTTMLQETVKEGVPECVLPIIEEGIKDGSIHTQYPSALAEFIMITVNIWLNPMICECTLQQLYDKFKVFQQILLGFDLDIIDEEFLSRLLELASIRQNM